MALNWWRLLTGVKASASPRRRTPARSKVFHALRFERFEDRVLLSFGALPSYDPSRLTQALFGLDASKLVVSAGQLGTVSNFYQFALNGQAASVEAKFDLAPADPASTRDGALALYDSSGNVLMVADADPIPGHPGFESLTATLTARKVYTLGVFFQAGALADQFNVTATMDPQVARPAIALDLTTGKAATTVDSFVTPATVNYYPLNLLDAGASGSVTVTPTGLDVNAFATLFRRDAATGPWQPIASSSGSAAFSLPITPSTNRSLTDASYLLAVATRNFSMAARSYTIDVQAAGPLLAPSSISLATVTDLLTPPPAAVGTAQVIQSGNASGQPLFRFRGPSAGIATLQLKAIAFGQFRGFAPVLSIYDAAGTRLLAVSSNTAPGATAVVALPVQAGAAYVMRVSAGSGSSQVGPFDLTVQTPYTPADLPLNPLAGNVSVTTVTGITVGPSQGARFYRLNPAVGTNVLVIGVTPEGASPIAAKVVLVGPNLSPVTLQVAAGQPLLLPLDVSSQVSPLDLYVAGTQGSDPATLQIGQLHLPTVLDFTSLRPVEMGLNGQLMAAPDLTQSARAFGSLGGVQYYQLTTGAGTTTLSVQGSGGAQPLLAHYRQDGGVFRLAASALPSGPQATLTETLTGSQLQGVAAFALGFAGTGTNAFSVTAPKPVGVGVAMVPDLETDACHPSPQSPPCSVLHISNVTLEHDFQQHLWTTILPFNLTGIPTVTFQPANSAAPLQAKVSVYFGDGTPVIINQMNQPGQKLTFTLNKPLDQLQGKTLLFRVEPVRGQPLGSGIYTLSMTVPTGDPHPFELPEQSWELPDASADFAFYNSHGFSRFLTVTSDHGIIPAFTPVVDVAQNQFGHGVATGQFTVPLPYYYPVDGPGGCFGNSGALQVFRFWAITPGPVVVKTVLIDPTLHTTLKIYQAVFDSNHQVASLKQAGNPVVTANTGWFPADRSRIDAQSYVNDFNQLKYGASDAPYGGSGGNLYYVVVKNQEGSKGRFNLVVDTAPMPLVGIKASPPADYNGATTGQVAYIPPTTGGSVALNAYLGNYPGLVGYFPVQVPANHNGTFSVSSLIAHFDHFLFYTGSGYWDFALFDATGKPLPGTVSDGTSVIGNVPFTAGSFPILDGPQMVFLRIRSKANAAVSTDAQLIISADLKPTSLTLPPTTFSGTNSMLPTNPQGDGMFTASVSSQGEVKAYTFQAAAGPVRVDVVPSAPGDVQLSWGIYVNNKLIAWNQTGADPASTTTTVLLPDLREPFTTLDGFTGRPLPNPDYPYDFTPPGRASYDTVVVYVRALTTPRPGSQFTVATQTFAVVPQRNLTTGEPVTKAGDLFTATLDGTAVLPMFTGGWAVSSNSSLTTASISGLAWSRLVVPDGNSGSVHLSANVGGGIIPHWLQYDLYSIAFDAQGHYTGRLLASDTRRQFGSSVEVDLPGSVVGGASYYVRLGDLNNPATAIPVTISAKYAKTCFSSPFCFLALPPTDSDYSHGPLDHTEPSPDGHFSRAAGGINPGTGLLDTAVFWVGSGGQTRFDVQIFTTASDPDTNPYIALYRGFVGGPSEFQTVRLTLVDFVNDASTADFRNYRLNVYLGPGMYVLKVVRTKTAGTARINLDASLPAYVPEEVVVDPKDGASSNWLQAINSVLGNAGTQGLGHLPDKNLLDQYRTTFYHVVTPGANQGGMLTAKADGASGPDMLTGNNALLTLWKQPSGRSEKDSHLFPTLSAKIEVTSAKPATEFWIGLHRDNLFGKAAVTVLFDVPMSGVPDWVVDPIKLSPDNGQTRVEVTVHNVGYGLAFPTTAWLQFTDASKPAGQQYITSELSEDVLSGSGSVTHVFTWRNPGSPDDSVTYVTNYTQPRNGQPILAELNVLNDSQTVKLSTVDPASPVVSIHLADPKMVANGDDSVPTWGRYVAGILGVQTDIKLQINSSSAGLYQLNIEGVGYSYSLSAAGTAMAYALKNFDFGKLAATSSSNPNRLRVVATDQYGLRSDPDAGTKVIQVVPYPSWLSNDGGDTDSTVKFDPAKYRYNLRYHNALIDLHANTDILLNGGTSHVPLIGDTDNRFLIEVTGTATASLNPNEGVPVFFAAHILVEVVGQTIYEKTYSLPGGDVSEHIAFLVNLAIGGQTLDTNSAKVYSITLFLKNIELVGAKTKEIPLLYLGIPKVAELQVSIQYGVSAILNAAVTIGVDPSRPGRWGFFAPTFISVAATASATLAGQVKVLGYNAAKLSGTISYTVTLDYGLKTPRGQFVSFGDFFNSSCFGGGAGLKFELVAKVFGIQVWSYPLPLWTLPIQGCTVIKGASEDQTPPTPPDPQVKKGSDPAGPLQLAPDPNLVIDPATGKALYVQTINNPPAPGVLRGNLAFDRRSDGAWSPLTTLPETSHVTNPVLALTHDRPGTPAVVVYNALDSAGDPANLTVNQYLTGQSLRWRYYDGTVWGGESTLLSDGRFNSNPGLSFNPAGQGVVAWVHNTNPNPVDNSGNTDRTANQIEVAVWDPVQHAWLAPQALTNNAFGNSAPAVFADPSGKLYVVWLQDTTGGNQVMYSIYNGTAWSNPAVLPITGLPAGGAFGEVAIGSESVGRLDVLLSYSHALPGGVAENVLYNRPSTAANFAAAAAVEVVASHADFSHLRTLQAPNGGLIAYWQQSDGVTNEVFTSRIGPTGTIWSDPAPLTAGNPNVPGSTLPTGSHIPFVPSVAVDTDGRLQAVFEVVAAPGSRMSPPSPDQPVGNPLGAGVASSSVRSLPQLVFSQALFFPNNGPAPQGSTEVENGAPSGTSVLALAQISNRGLGTDQVRLDYFDGLPGSGSEILLGTQTITLGPGQAFDISRAFVAKPGAHTYAIRATALGGQEVTGVTPHVTSATLVGMINLVVAHVTLSNSTPRGGETVTVTADIANLSDQAIGSFQVGFYQGDPNYGPAPAPIRDTRTVSSLAPFGHAMVTFSWTVPATGGDFVLTVRADPGKVLQQATRLNSDGHLMVSVWPDAAVVPYKDIPAVRAVVQNYTGVNNVIVTANVSNLGQADLANVPVQLWWSLEDGAFQQVGTTTIATLAVGANQFVSFTVSGLAGQNRYRVVVDPNNALPDANRANNVAETMLMLQGLPNLQIGTLRLVGAPDGLGSLLTVPLVNRGIAGASGISVEVYALGWDISPTATNIAAHGRLLGQTVIDQLAALDDTKLTFAIRTLNLPYQQLCVVVDRGSKLTLADHMHNITSIVVPLTPATPTDLTATALSDTQIQLTWVNHAISATQILIFRAPQGVDWVNIATVAPTTTTYTDSSLAPGTYYYRVQTYNEMENRSAFSTFDSASVPITPTHFSVTPSSTTPMAGTAFTITVTALTAGNQTTIGYRGIVHFTSTDGQAVLPADYRFTAADNGVHTFTVTLKTAGSQGVTTRDTANGSITGTAAVAVSPAAAMILLVANFPSLVLAGVAGTVGVTAKDPYGNVATGYRGTVHLTSSDGQAVLPGDYRFNVDDNGAHAFSVTLKTAGTQTITATDTTTATITGVQGGIVVTPAAAITLIVAGFPSPTTAGVAGMVTITAKDLYGNLATGYRGTVTFTSSDGQAVRPGDYAFTVADNGVHTFSITLKTAGTQSISATDIGTATLTGMQAGIVVNPAAASLLRVANFPSPTVAGAGQTFTVTAQDAFGNTAIGYTGIVTFTTSDPQGIVPDNYSFTAADHGSHTFGGAMLTVGTQVLTATDTGNLTLNGTQGGIVVTPAPADHFDISTPDSSTAGTAFDVTVTARDPYGNIDTNYQGTVTFTSADAQAALPDDYTFTTDDGGVVTFAAGATLFTAGSQDVTATDTSSGITGSANVIVTPAAADHFSLSAPASAPSGTAFDVTVIAQDPYGNTDTNYQGTVTFSTSDTDPGVVLPADYTFTPDDGGSHTFRDTGLGETTLITVGDQTITATDTDSGISGAATVTVQSSGAPGTGGSGANGKARGAVDGQIRSPAQATAPAPGRLADKDQGLAPIQSLGITDSQDLGRGRGHRPVVRWHPGRLSLEEAIDQLFAGF